MSDIGHTHRTPLRIGSLFSGIGGLELGLERAGVGRTAWQCESSPQARAVLAQRWPGVPCMEDVHSVNRTTVAPVDVLCGGFPCQDISVAGGGAGLDGSRSGLWHEFARAIEELEPRIVVVENVAALVTRGLDRVIARLTGIGYRVAARLLRAPDVGAPHRRERIFLVAWRDVGPRGISDADIWQRPERDAEPGQMGAQNVADGMCSRLEERGRVTPNPRAELATAERDRGAMDHAHGGGRGRFGVGGVLNGERAAFGRDADGRGSEAPGMVWPPGPHDAAGWRDYLDRFPGREPAVTLSNGRRALNPRFVEALMGFPDGWTDARMRTPKGERSLSRRERLRMLGNAVMPQVGEVVGRQLKGLVGEPGGVM